MKFDPFGIDKEFIIFWIVFPIFVVVLIVIGNRIEPYFEVKKTKVLIDLIGENDGTI